MSTENTKLKLAIYWGAACGGCCVSVLDVHERLLEIVAAADLVFWPIALDAKYEDLEKLEDGYLDITLFNGAIRNSENEYIANLLRQKSKLMVGYGSCAQLGGIPGLANFTNKQDIFDRVYQGSESTFNENDLRPKTTTDVTEGTLELPVFFDEVLPLEKAVNVDYYIPGCPPQSERFMEVVEAIVSGAELPPPGSVIGAKDKTQCDECERKKTDNKKINRFFRPYEIDDDGETCFLEQGVICMGPATRGGCEYRCIKGNAPCRGCYGPPQDIADPGAKMMSAIATMIDSNDPNEVDSIIEDVADPAGTFYRFSLPSSMIRRTVS